MTFVGTHFFFVLRFSVKVSWTETVKVELFPSHGVTGNVTPT